MSEIKSSLCVPEDFAKWCQTLPKSVLRKLSIHDLRQVWEGSVREAYKFARPWLDAKGVYHRHNGVDFPSSDACPYCQIIVAVQEVVDERDQERQWRENLVNKTVPDLEDKVRARDKRIRDLESRLEALL